MGSLPWSWNSAASPGVQQSSLRAPGEVRLFSWEGAGEDRHGWCRLLGTAETGYCLQLWISARNSLKLGDLLSLTHVLLELLSTGTVSGLVWTRELNQWQMSWWRALVSAHTSYCVHRPLGTYPMQPSTAPGSSAS